MRNPSSFATTDLTLATYLSMEGYVAGKVRRGERQNGHPIGAWKFENGDAIAASIIDFKKGECRVEPKEFHNCLNKCREEMFDFLGIGKRRQK